MFFSKKKKPSKRRRNTKESSKKTFAISDKWSAVGKKVIKSVMLLAAIITLLTFYFTYMEPSKTQELTFKNITKRDLSKLGKPITLKEMELTNTNSSGDLEYFLDIRDRPEPAKRIGPALLEGLMTNEQGAPSETQAYIHLLSGDFYLSYGNLEKAITLGEKASEMAEKESKELSKARIHSYFFLLKCYEKRMDNLSKNADQPGEMGRLWLEIRRLKSVLEKSGLPIVWSPNLHPSELEQISFETIAEITAAPPPTYLQLATHGLPTDSLGLSKNLSVANVDPVRGLFYSDLLIPKNTGLSLTEFRYSEFSSPIGVNNGHISVVGVDNYSNNLPTLKYARTDALKVFAAFKRIGFTGNRLLGSAADRNGILTHLAIAARDTPEDQPMVFYFAGHGFTDQQGRAALATAGTTATDVEVVYLDEIARMLSQRTAPVSVILDACMNGVEVANSNPVTDSAFSQIRTNSNLTWLLATRPGGTALEVGDLGGGLFTYYLVNRLNGLIDSGATIVDPTVVARAVVYDTVGGGAATDDTVGPGAGADPTVGACVAANDTVAASADPTVTLTTTLLSLFNQVSIDTSKAASASGHQQSPIYFHCELITDLTDSDQKEER